MTLDRVNTNLERIEVLADRRKHHDREARINQGELIQAMRQARDTHTLQEIGDAAGLSKQRVQQLLKEN